MSKLQREYWIVEHIWRAIRAVFVLAGTILWLYNLAPEWAILACYAAATLADQFHGKICKAIESVLHYKHQHTDWE